MQGQETPADDSTLRASSGSHMSVSQPWPLPPFTFDPSLSEDENFLTYSLVLARFSVSQKGHMGALLVRPSLEHPPDQVLPEDIAKVRFADEAIRHRVITHANNTPLLCHEKPKAVPEIHAEALCIARAASLGRPTARSTIYVTFPPCNECFKLIVAAGVRRCVFRKNVRYPAGEAVLGSALVHNIEMVTMLKQKTVTMSDQEFLDILELEKQHERGRDLRSKAAWQAMGETALVTRNRVNGWWTQFMANNRVAIRSLQATFGVVTMRGKHLKEIGGKGSSDRLGQPGDSVAAPEDESSPRQAEAMKSQQQTKPVQVETTVTRGADPSKEAEKLHPAAKRPAPDMGDGDDDDAFMNSPSKKLAHAETTASPKQDAVPAQPGLEASQSRSHSKQLPGHGSGSVQPRASYADLDDDDDEAYMNSLRR